MQDNNKLGNLIKEARQREKLSLRKAADLIGISNPYLSQLENGHTKKPNAYRLRKIAYVLDIPFTQLAHYSETELAPGIDEKYRSLARKLPVEVYDHIDSFDSFLKFFKKNAEKNESEDFKDIDDDSLMRAYSFLCYVLRVSQTLWKDFEEDFEEPVISEKIQIRLEKVFNDDNDLILDSYRLTETDRTQALNLLRALFK